MGKQYGHRTRGFHIVLVFGLVSTILPCCCPSGAWEDNFGSLYSIITISPTEFEQPQPFLTTGVVDTRDMGCGVWNIRPPAEGEPAVTEENPVAWVAENPHKNPADQCCYALRFDGQITPGGCSLILGEYYNVGGKCEQSGQMFLQAVQ